jgi:hypothetical protein
MREQEFWEVVSVLDEMPESILWLTMDLTERELKWKPAANEFSALEQICHLRDLEREGYTERIRKMLSENQPRLPDFDGSRIAGERDYNSQDFASAFDAFALARGENVLLMKTLAPDQLQRSGVLDGVGAITVEKLCLLMHEHDQSHLKELSELRKAQREERRDEG